MQGLMQDWPLLCSKLIDHAALWHGDREIVSRSVEGPIHRTNYAAVRGRALKVAQRLEKDGIVLGDRCGTLPHTATGKVLKTALRERFQDYRLPTG